jgi:hypothetical protein
MKEELRKLRSAPWETFWSEARAIWARADAVYAGPTGPILDRRESFEYALAAELLRRFPEGRSRVLEGLLDPDPRVAAYCLVALAAVGSLNRSDLPSPVFGRRDSLTLHSGCIRGSTTFADFVEGYFDERDNVEEAALAERQWAGRERACPHCGTRFTSVQDLGACPSCKKTFRASRP